STGASLCREVLRPAPAGEGGGTTAPSRTPCHAQPHGPGSGPMYVLCQKCKTPIEVGPAGTEPFVCSACGSTVVPPDAPPARLSRRGRGRRLGRFEVLQQVGTGAFGNVYRAHDPQLDRVVALKIPRAGIAGREHLERFLREARLAAQLRHPAIVTVYEVGEH